MHSERPKLKILSFGHSVCNRVNGVMHLIDADGVANTVDPDQSAPSGSALFAQTCLSNVSILPFIDVIPVGIILLLSKDQGYWMMDGS